jgi:quinol monooxygenase YgiN
MIKVVAALIAKPGHADALKKVLGALVTETRKEAGCIAYDLCQREDTAEHFVMLEQWADAAALKAHFETPHLQGALGAAKDLLASPPEIVRYKPVD